MTPGPAKGDYDTHAKYLRNWRIANGQTKHVMVDVEVLRFAINESQLLCDGLPPEVLDALEELNERKLNEPTQSP